MPSFLEISVFSARNSNPRTTRIPSVSWLLQFGQALVAAIAGVMHVSQPSILAQQFAKTAGGSITYLHMRHCRSFPISNISLLHWNMVSVCSSSFISTTDCFISLKCCDISRLLFSIMSSVKHAKIHLLSYCNILHFMELSYITVIENNNTHNIYILYWDLMDLPLSLSIRLFNFSSSMFTASTFVFFWGTANIFLEFDFQKVRP